MKHAIIYIFTFLFLTIACDKLILQVEGQDARLQGKWQVTVADTIFYNFQKNLFEYQIYLQKDSIFSAYGYYTLIDDTVLYLELISEYCYMNYNIHTYRSLDFLGWDTIGTNGLPGGDTLARYYHIEKLSDNELRLIHPSESLVFKKF